jgi:hypothetical protein
VNASATLRNRGNLIVDVWAWFNARHLLEVTGLRG